MLTTTRTRLALGTVVAALALTGGVTEAASAASSVRRATKLLQGKRLTTYISGTVTDATIDRSVDFCRGGRFLYRSTVTSSGGGAVQEIWGRWRVVAARIRRGSGWAKVRWRTRQGHGTIRIVSNARGVRADGQVVEVTRSPVC
jgi:hypothetical protein